MNQSVDQLAGQSVDQLLDQPVDQILDQLLDQPVDQSVEQSPKQPLNQNQQIKSKSELVNYYRDSSNIDSLKFKSIAHEKYLDHARNRARSHDKIFFLILNPDLNLKRVYRS